MQGGNDLIGDAPFDLLALTVLRVQRQGDGHRLGQVAGEQQAQGVFGRLKAPRGVEARRELEPDLESAQQGRGLSHSFQRHEAGPLGFGQAIQADGNQAPVFAGEGDDVGNRAQCDQIQQRAQVEIDGVGQASLASALGQRVGELEGNSHGAEFGKGGN